MSEAGRLEAVIIGPCPADPIGVSRAEWVENRQLVDPNVVFFQHPARLTGYPHKFINGVKLSR
jgi:hypothetical protein